MVCNCRAEISPRPVSQDVHLCTTFYLYRLNYVAHTLQILCFCQQLVCFWGDINLARMTSNRFQKVCFIFASPHFKNSGRIWCAGKYLQREPLHVPSDTQLFRISRIPKPAANGIEYELWFIRPSSRSITAQLRLLLFPRASSHSVSWWLCALSLPSTGFLARLSVSLQICLPDSSLEFWKLVPWGRINSLSGIIPKSMFCSLMRHWPANVRLNVIGKIRVRRPAPHVFCTV